MLYHQIQCGRLSTLRMMFCRPPKKERKERAQREGKTTGAVLSELAR
jgi:hypothetical protein